ncbi:MAG TPA: TetR/AcrR family transcriptional regulator [Magnetospirillaceae bacterium]|jgi:AcrR family transcriptional regulator
MPAPAIEATTPSRRQRKRHQTLEHLVSTALRLFEAQGYDVVTMEQIAAEADVAKRTLYNHFPVKEALLAHWIHAQLERDLQRLAPQIERRTTFASRISYLLDVSATWCERHRAYMPPYLRFRFMSADTAIRDGAQDATANIGNTFAALIEAGQRRGEVRTDLTAPHLATLFHHLYLGALMRWLTVPGLTLHDELRAAVKLFVEGAERSHPPSARRRHS